MSLIPCPCYFCEGKLVTKYVRRKHSQNVMIPATTLPLPDHEAADLESTLSSDVQTSTLGTQ